MRFCPKCGKDITKGTFCNDCQPQILEYEDIVIEICNCGRLLEHGKWHPYTDLNHAVEKVVKTNIKQKAVKIKANINKLKIFRGKNQVSVKVHFNNEIYELPLNIILVQCATCSRKDTQYFEGIIQLRNPKDEVVSYIEKEIETSNTKGIFINKKEKVTNGIDFYVTDQKFIQLLGRKVIRRFGGLIKINARLHTKNHQTSKDLYRINVLIQLPDFKAGDVLEINGEPIKITHLGKQIKGLRLKNLKTLLFDYGKTKYSKLTKFKTRVTKKFPQLEVLHPETYQSTQVLNQEELDINDEVDVVDYNGLYIC